MIIQLLLLRQAGRSRRTHEKAAQRATVASNEFKATFLSMTLVDSSIDALITGKYITKKALKYTASSPSVTGGTADNTSRNEIRPLFALVKLAPPYIQLNLSNRKPLMSCLFTGCIKKQVIELQRAIVPELLGV
jgi:hypothetical protein